MVLNYCGDTIVAMGNSKGIVTSHKLGSIDAAKQQYFQTYVKTSPLKGGITYE